MDWEDNYGTRIRGYIHAPATGDYTFWISGDDNCELWLSTTSDVSNKKLIARVPNWTLINKWDEDAVLADPMSFVEELRFVALIGIIDPLRPSSKEAVRVAHEAGIDVRMITGDHVVTATAIGKELGLGPGAVSGA